MKVTIVYSEPEEIKSVKLPEDLDVTLLDENSVKTQRKARSIKSHFAAIQTPCVFVANDKDDVFKVFYREEFKDPIDKFLEWFDENRS